MKSNKTILAVLALAAAAAAAPAAAQQPGYYLGGSIGLAKYKDTCQQVGTAGATACDGEDVGYRIFAGYNFNRYIALEAAYVDLGTAAAVVGGVLTEAETNGADVAGVFSIPIFDRASLFAKLGVYRLRTTRESPGGARSGETDSGYTYGVGLGYDFGSLGIRFEWQRYDNMPGIAADESVDVYGVGALFRF